ncbi:MAG: hypothetical protein LBC68_07745 [Prevotellaceae bacterium]|jgi:hypothetical protein|nr:hypothetical protein [Prevotellaceae bacterium]
MKRLLFILSFAFIACAALAQARVVNCRITKEYGFETKTVSLFGNVKVVTDPNEYAEFKVRIIKENQCCADLFVKIVNTEPEQCGEWRFVKSEKDAWITVRFVEEGWEDFTIRFVTSDPGSAYEDFSY